jgi:hypothetical protein
MISGCDRASQIFDNIRALFGKAEEGHEPIDVNELIRGALSTVQGDLDDHGIVSRRQASGRIAKNYRSQRPVRGGPHQPGPQRN